MSNYHGPGIDQIGYDFQKETDKDGNPWESKNVYNRDDRSNESRSARLFLNNAIRANKLYLSIKDLRLSLGVADMEET